VTHDGGATWNATNPIPLEPGEGSPIFNPSFVSPSVWLVESTSDQLATTSDAGGHWSVIHLEGLGPYGPSAIEFSSASDGWAMVCESSTDPFDGSVQCNGSLIEGAPGEYALYRTNDGGATWTLVLTNEQTGG
jgi:photosystem II stability/assembly factor-like uncharacterized protein